MQSTYYTKLDNDELVEFRIHNKSIVLRSIIVICHYSILYLILFLFSPKNQIIFVSLFVSISILMINYIGKILYISIIINKKEKTILSLNLRDILFKEIAKMTFDDVKNLLIKARPRFSNNYSIQYILEPFERTHDKIIAQCKHQKEKILFISDNSSEINEITYKISQLMTCPIFVEDDEQ